MCTPQIDSYRPPEQRVSSTPLPLPHRSGDSTTQAHNSARRSHCHSLDGEDQQELGVLEVVVSWVGLGQLQQQHSRGAVHRRLLSKATFSLHKHSQLVYTHEAPTTWRCRFPSKIGLPTKLWHLICVWKLSLSASPLLFFLSLRRFIVLEQIVEKRKDGTN